MSTDTPTRHDIQIRAAWPPVKVVTIDESRRMHASTAALMLAVALIGVVLAPSPLWAAFTSAYGLLAGVALQSWRLHPYIHGNGGGE